MQSLPSRSLFSVVLGGVALVLGVQVAHAQGAVKTTLPDSLVKQAKVAEPAARKTALAKVPKGRLAAVELEKEKGHLQYSYDFKVPGQSGVTEVDVDAVTGAVIAVAHEDAAAEAKEAAQEKAEKGGAKPAGGKGKATTKPTAKP